MDIGTTETTYTIEPIVDPVPREEPVPVPEEAPLAPEEAPA
jgi:hypothetical protein